MKFTIKRYYYFVFFIIFFPGIVFGGDFQIAPVNIYLSPKKPFSFITFTNNSKNENISFSATMMHWTQKNGEDVLTKTNDLIVYPPISTIKPKQEQIFRIGSLSPMYFKQEKFYRVIFQELPQPKKKKNAKNKYSTVKFYYRLLVPIFVQPIQQVKVNLDQLKWRLKKTKHNNIVKLSMYNPSNLHVRVNKVEIYDSKNTRLLAKASRLFYILPGQLKEVLLKSKSNMTKGKLNISLKTSWGDITKLVDAKRLDG